MVIGALRLATESIYARIRPGGMLLVQLVEDISCLLYTSTSSTDNLGDMNLVRLRYDF